MANPTNPRFSIHNVSVQYLPPSTHHPKKRFGHALNGPPPSGLSLSVVQPIPVRRKVRTRRKK